MATLDEVAGSGGVGRDQTARQVTGVVLRRLDDAWRVLSDVSVTASGSRDESRPTDVVLVGPAGVFVVRSRVAAESTALDEAAVDDDLLLEADDVTSTAHVLLGLLLADLAWAPVAALGEGNLTVQPLLSLVGPHQAALVDPVGHGVMAGSPSALVRLLGSLPRILDEEALALLVPAVQRSVVRVPARRPASPRRSRDDGPLRRLSSLGRSRGSEVPVEDDEAPHDAMSVPGLHRQDEDGVGTSGPAPAAGRRAVPPSGPEGTSPRPPSAPEHLDEEGATRPEPLPGLMTGEDMFVIPEPEDRPRPVRLAVSATAVLVALAAATTWALGAGSDLTSPAGAESPARSPRSVVESVPEGAPGQARDDTTQDATPTTPTPSSAVGSDEPDTTTVEPVPATTLETPTGILTSRPWGAAAMVPSYRGLPAVSATMSSPRRSSVVGSDGFVRWTTRVTLRNTGERQLALRLASWGLTGTDASQKWSAGLVGPGGSSGAGPVLRPGAVRDLTLTWVLPEAAEPTSGTLEVGGATVVWRQAARPGA